MKSNIKISKPLAIFIVGVAIVLALAYSLGLVPFIILSICKVLNIHISYIDALLITVIVRLLDSTMNGALKQINKK